MSSMIEVYVSELSRPSDEEKILQIALEWGGRLTFREATTPSGIGKGVCLTLEFAEESSAELAANAVRDLGFHVEGPCDY